MRYKKPSVPVSTIVNAPPEIIWKFLTEREFLSQWWWTPPIKGQITSLNVYPTGSILCQLTHKNRTYNSNYVYIQVSPNGRLVLTNALFNFLFKMLLHKIILGAALQGSNCANGHCRFHHHNGPFD